MALVTPIDAPGSYPTAGVALSRTTASTGGDEFEATGREMLVYENVSADTAHDLTVYGQTDDQGRTITITQEVAFGTAVFIGPFTKTHGWVTAAGRISILSETPADGRISVIRLPNE